MASTHAWIQTHTPEEIRNALPATARLDDSAAELDYMASIQDIYSVDGLMPESGPTDLVRVLSPSVKELRSSTLDPRLAYTNGFQMPR